MAEKTAGHFLNLGSEHELQHPEGVRTSPAWHFEALTGGIISGSVLSPLREVCFAGAPRFEAMTERSLESEFGS